MANGVARNLAKEVGGKTRENLKLPVESLYFNPEFEKREDLGDIDWIVNNILESGFWSHEPVLVRPNKESKKFEIVNGRRRFRACLKAKEMGWQGLVEVAVTDPNMSDEDLVFMTINSNNDSRKPFTFLEEGSYFKILVDEMQVSPEEISKRIGKSVTYVLDRLSLTNVNGEMKDEFQSFINEGKLSPTAAVKISKISDEVERKKVWDEIKTNHNTQMRKNESEESSITNTKDNKKEKNKNKIKISDVIKTNKKGIEHISIKVLKENLSKCEEMFGATGSDYWECGIKVLKATLENKVFE